MGLYLLASDNPTTRAFGPCGALPARSRATTGVTQARYRPVGLDLP